MLSEPLRTIAKKESNRKSPVAVQRIDNVLGYGTQNATIRGRPCLLDQETPSPGWNDYLARHPQGSLYHDPRWAELIRSCFGHKTYFLTSDGRGTLKGILPLAYIRSRIFGKALVSMPYFNYGGLLADDDIEAIRLISSALDLKQELGADYIELRQTKMLPGGWPVKSHKVIMLLSLPTDPAALWWSLKSKLRTRIRGPEKRGFSFHWGKQELLDEFHLVFAENMRDLGTPVYPKSFFEAILWTFPQNANIAVVRLGKQPMAVGFLLGYRNKVEIPWSSSLRRFNHLSPNMFLYWQILKQSVLEGFEVFDFGRSTRDSGTFTFKQQWGAVPQDTYWVYPRLDKGLLPEHSPRSSKYSWATRVWKHLPLFITNRCGPWIVKNIP